MLITDNELLEGSHRGHAVHFVTAAQDETGFGVVHPAAGKGQDKTGKVRNRGTHLKCKTVWNWKWITKPAKWDSIFHSKLPSPNSKIQKKVHLKCTEYMMWKWDCWCIRLTRAARCRMQNKCGRIWNCVRWRMWARRTSNLTPVFAWSELYQMYSVNFYNQSHQSNTVVFGIRPFGLYPFVRLFHTLFQLMEGIYDAFKSPDLSGIFILILLFTGLKMLFEFAL